MTPEERAAYRAFVREHHPDRGGDPDAFVAGLAAMRARPESDVEDDVVFVRRHRRFSETDSDGPTSHPRSAP